METYTDEDGRVWEISRPFGARGPTQKRLISEPAKPKAKPKKKSKKAKKE